MKIDSKYDVTLESFPKFKFFATRNGEAWRDLTGDNLIMAMYYKIEELEEANKELMRKLINSKGE